MLSRKRAFAALTLSALFATTAHAQLSDNAVRIGVLTDMAGVYSDVTGKGSVTAAQMAADDCLKAECAGLTVEVLSADHQNKADIGVNTARAWIDTRGVDVLVDMSNASLQLAIAPVVKEKNRVALFPGGTARLTNDACQPEHLVQWMWDTYSQVAGIAGRLTQKDTKWFLVTADYAFGQALEADTKTIVDAKGGKVLGSVRHPFPSSDLSSFLLRAQSSGADIVALANAGGDTLNSLKTAREFGFGQSKQKLVAYFLTVMEVRALGLEVAQGTTLTEGFYWDLDERTRAWSQRFLQAHGTMPSAIHAGIYSAVRHYLKAVAAGKTDEAKATVNKMHELPIADDIVRNARLRPDGRMVHDYYVFEAKKPAESKGEWDLYNLVATVPGDEAFKPLEQSACPQLRK
jgi:branched-chain amino acid transport system substrate-binding protein